MEYQTKNIKLTIFKYILTWNIFIWHDHFKLYILHLTIKTNNIFFQLQHWWCTSLFPWLLSKQLNSSSLGPKEKAQQRLTCVPDWCLGHSKRAVFMSSSGTWGTWILYQNRRHVSEWNLNSYDPETRPQDSTEYSMLCINRMSYCKIYQSTT